MKAIQTGFFIYWCISLVLFTAVYNFEAQRRVYLNNYASSTISQLQLEQRKETYYSLISAQEYIDTEEQVFSNLNDSKIEGYLKKEFPKSPLIGMSGVFFKEGYEKGFDDEEIRLLISISGTESGFGTKAWNHNYWGIFCNRNGKYSLNCGWQTTEYAISRSYDLIGSYLRKWDGTKEGIKKTFVGSYCQSACSGYSESTWYFYNHLIAK